MNLITATILLTCCSFAAADFVQCGNGTSCVKLWECPQYSEQFGKFYRVHKGRDSEFREFLMKTLGPVTCNLKDRIPEVCCEDPVRCGNVQSVRRLGPGGMKKVDPVYSIALLVHKTESGEKFGCAGVLISDRHVLTAAQCLDTYGDELVGVRLGEYDLGTAEDCVIDPKLPYRTAGVIKVGIERQIPHENYSSLRRPSDFDLVKYDIAVLKLDQSVNTTVIQPICLPDPVPQVSRQGGSTFDMDGWGVPTSDGSPKSNTKLTSRWTQVNKAFCEKSIDRWREDYICALSKSSDIPWCLADLGGALMGFNRLNKRSVVGIHSPELKVVSSNCGKPSTFIDVRQYLVWIQQQMLYEP